MRILLVLVSYLIFAVFAFGLMVKATCPLPGKCVAGPGLYFLWIILFGYGGGYVACLTGLADWMMGNDDAR